MTNLRIRTRFILLILLFVCGFAVYGAWSFRTLAELKVNGPIYQRIVQSKDLIADILPPPKYIIESYLVTLLLAEKAEPAHRTALIAKLDALRKEYNSRQEYWLKEQLEPALADAMVKGSHAHADRFYAIAFGEYIPALHRDDAEAVKAARTKMDAAYEAHRQQVDIAVQLASRRAQEDEASALARIDAGNWQLLAILVLSLAAAVTMAMLIIRSISRPLNDAMRVAKEVAAGDLSHDIEIRNSDETAELLQSLKEMNDSLARIVGDVRSCSNAMMDASKRISDGNQELSSRTEQQASSLEETASSMEELTSTVRQNADSAREANELAAAASEVAREGGAFVTQVFQTMRSIDDSAKKIVDIISVINGIAFQTNILALNAAVEAARAGEQGRGFAVVAAEVRSLAQRSADAAKEIEMLINDSVDKIGAGVKLVDRAGTTMDEIVNGVNRVSSIVGEIAAASREQSDGIEQVNVAISQMDNATQQNASMAEEITSTAASLEEQAEHLYRLVSVFRLAGARAWQADSALQSADAVAAVPPPHPAGKETAPRLRLLSGKV